MYSGGMHGRVNNYEKIRDNFLSDKMGKLTNRAIRIKLKIFSGRKNEAKKELAEAMKITKIYYNNIPSSVVVALESLAALIYFQDGRYDLAYAQCQRVIEMGKKVYGKEMVADFQLHIHALLGKIYENKGSPELALKEYKKCLQYYDEHSYGRAINSYEYGELLANLCVLHYQQKEYNKSKIYFQKLASSFGLGNKIIEKLIKELPVEYIYQIGAHDHG